MSLENRVSELEKESRPEEQETIIPKFQTPNTCVFCTDNYDSVFYFIYRTAYNCDKETDFKKQDKETCIHHTDDSLIHSLRSAGFVWSAITDHGDKSMKYTEVIELLKNKQERQRLLTKEYEESKKYTCAVDLYLPESSGVTKPILDKENEIQIQNKIIQNKLKIYYNKAIEVLCNFDNEKEFE